MVGNDRDMPPAEPAGRQGGIFHRVGSEAQVVEHLADRLGRLEGGIDLAIVRMIGSGGDDQCHIAPAGSQAANADRGVFRPAPPASDADPVDLIPTGRCVFRAETGL